MLQLQQSGAEPLCPWLGEGWSLLQGSLEEEELGQSVLPQHVLQPSTGKCSKNEEDGLSVPRGEEAVNRLVPRTALSSHGAK